MRRGREGEAPALVGCPFVAPEGLPRRPPLALPRRPLHGVEGRPARAIGLEALSIVYAPTYGDYGDVLRAYNERHPETAWSSQRLGVAPAEAGDARRALTMAKPRRRGVDWRGCCCSPCS